MGLENLSSVFNENIDLIAGEYQSKQSQHINDSKVSSLGGAHMQSPILDATLRNAPSFVLDTPGIGSLAQPFRTETFDSRIPKNEGIKFYNINTYQGTQHIPENPTTFPTNYQDLKTLGLDLGVSNGWQSLYNQNHTAKNIENPDVNNPFQPYIYGGNINRDKLDIGNHRSTSGFLSNFFSRDRGPEPYIVSEIPTGDTLGELPFSLDGRFRNQGSRFAPLLRAVTDAERINKYLYSDSGLFNMAQKNASAFMTQVQTINNPEGGLNSNALINMPLLYGGILPGVLHASPLQISANVSGRVLGEGLPNVPLPLGGIGDKIQKYPNQNWRKVLGLGDATQISGQGTDAPLMDELNGENFPQIPESGIGNALKQALFPKASKQPLTKDNPFGRVKMKSGGDKATRKDFFNYPNGGATSNINRDTRTSGCRLYFVDLRDSQVMTLRAYVEGITENISPSWATSTFVGRSEPVYVYERAERDVSFSLKLFAHTHAELEMIYKKMNKLSSFCYPEYAEDEFFSTTANVRMKPPLIKMRLGNLYGAANNEMTGFIKTLTYTIPDEGVWDIDFEIPRLITAAIGFQVIHGRPPQLNEPTFDDSGNKTGSESFKFFRGTKNLINSAPQFASGEHRTKYTTKL